MDVWKVRIILWRLYKNFVSSEYTGPPEKTRMGSYCILRARKYLNHSVFMFVFMVTRCIPYGQQVFVAINILIEI